jgi:DNA processing protein
VPGPITSPVSRGSNRLLQDGAKPALGLRDMFEELGLKYAGDVPSISFPAGITEPERRMLDLLALGDEHIDELAVRLQTGPSEALAVLTSLEIRGLVEQKPGKIFRRAHAAFDQEEERKGKGEK